MEDNRLTELCNRLLTDEQRKTGMHFESGGSINLFRHHRIKSRFALNATFSEVLKEVKKGDGKMSHSGLPPSLCPHSVFEYPCPTDTEPMCDSCSIFTESRAKEQLCPHCGTALAVEREVFSQDKLFDKHTCRGTYA